MKSEEAVVGELSIFKTGLVDIQFTCCPVHPSEVNKEKLLLLFGYYWFFVLFCFLMGVALSIAQVGLNYVFQAGLEPMFLLSLPPKYCNYMSKSATPFFPFVFSCS